MVVHLSKRPHNDAGYSLPEVVIVIAIMAILAGAAVLTTTGAIGAARADATVNSVVKELREARELALAERRNIEVQFLDPNQIAVLRHEVEDTTEVGTTLLETVTLEGRHRFLLPAGAIDTPDGFGNADAVDFGTATALLFTSEGTFVDQTGDPLNGTVFLNDPNEPNSLRAVTIFGPTALVRAHRWNGATWVD